MANYLNGLKLSPRSIKCSLTKKQISPKSKESHVDHVTILIDGEEESLGEPKR